jgi:hypothetical protein
MDLIPRNGTFFFWCGLIAILATGLMVGMGGLTDIAGLSREEAVQVMRQSARALLRSALADLDAGHN